MTNVGITFENLCVILEKVQSVEDDITTMPLDESENFVCCSNKGNALMYCANTAGLATGLGIQNVANEGVCDKDSTSTVCGP